jgi:hypothetical protein
LKLGNLSSSYRSSWPAPAATQNLGGYYVQHATDQLHVLAAYVLVLPLLPFGCSELLFLCVTGYVCVVLCRALAAALTTCHQQQQ